MFLASDRVDQRENKIRSFLSSEPSIALLLAAVNFEWTVSRAILFLSTTKNTTLRQKLRNYYSPDKYKELWKEEVVPHDHLPLAKLVCNWSSVLKGFDARNVIVHGEDRYTRNMGCVDPTGRLFYFDGSVLRLCRLDTMQDQELYRVPDGTRPSLPTCTADGKYIAFAYREDRAVSTETGRIYSTMAERYYQHPRCMIMRIDTRNGEAVAAWGERAWISHVLIHPHRPDFILFCHEGGSYVSQRMWTVDLSNRRGRKAQPLYVQRPGEFCVHEYFTRRGDVGFQYEVEREGQIEYYNGFIRPDGTWIRQFLLPGRRPGHIQSNTDNTLVVGDCGYLSPDDQDGRNYMSLMTHAHGRAHVRRLCRRVPGKTQYSHGHPIFSLNDKWVLYNSKIGNTHNIYMTDVESI